MRAGAIAPVLVAVLLGSGLVSGCGGGESSTEDYCAALADEKATLQRLSQRSGSAAADLEPAVEAFERLRDAAPADLRDEWTTYVNAWQGLTDALDAAGADATVFRDGKRPPGITAKEYDAIQDAATKLGSPAVRDASAGIEAHASDVCDVELGGTVG